MSGKRKVQSAQAGGSLGLRFLLVWLTTFAAYAVSIA